MKRIVSFPRMGKEYTLFFKELMEELGLEVRLPPPNSEETIKFGVKNSSDMMCYPYKVTLGNFKEALDNGANTLLTWDSRGRCRFRHYWLLQKQVLESKGYKFEIFPMHLNILSTFKKLNPSLSYYKIIKILWKFWKKLVIIDKEKRRLLKDKINIAIIGEIYTCLEESVNYDIIGKLNKLDANVYSTVTLSGFLRESMERLLKINIMKRKWKRKARKYLNGPLGGHGFEGIYYSLWLREKKIDGIIHLLPLSCMPESTIEPAIDMICEEGSIPLLRLPIDETNSETNVDTRVEAFIELIKRRKNG